ncbi:MAG: hypothetical protein QM736_27515 [Vicinamibacterales bacterium]
MKQMSGIPRPVDDLPVGSVSVRVIRGDMSNPVVNHPVEMRSGDRTLTVNTDDQGRAQFDGIPPGSPVTFSTTIDGEKLDSQPFNVQPQGGVRMLLVATDANAAKTPPQPSAPAVTGTVSIAGESRIIVEPSDESVSVYYVLDIVNGSSSPVNPEKPFVFTMPAAAVGTTVIQGSSPLASNKGRDVTVSGPFPPGTTAIQVAAEFPIGNGTVELAQAFPASMAQVVVIAKKAGDLKLASAQFTRNEETVIEGTTVVLGIGGELPAGQTFAMTISGLPHHSSVPRNIALVLAVLVVVLGVWAAARPVDPANRAAERKRLLARREKLFQDLVRLEQDHKRGKVEEPRYTTKREELVAALEHVYGALDEDDAGPEPASRAGVAA